MSDISTKRQIENSFKRATGIYRRVELKFVFLMTKTNPNTNPKQPSRRSTWP